MVRKSQAAAISRLRLIDWCASIFAICNSELNQNRTYGFLAIYHLVKWEKNSKHFLVFDGSFPWSFIHAVDFCFSPSLPPSPLPPLPAASAEYIGNVSKVRRSRNDKKIHIVFAHQQQPIANYPFCRHTMRVLKWITFSWICKHLNTELLMFTVVWSRC